MFCKYCGNILPDNAKTCPSCGGKQDQRDGTKVNQDCDHEHNSTLTFDTAPAKSGGNPFFNAIGEFFRRYADFSGQTDRNTFWLTILFLVIVNAIASQLPDTLQTLISLALLVPSLALDVRRLRDVGKQWTYILWGLLPLVGWIVLLIAYLKPSAPNSYNI